ncbi:MAG: DEAD/DEAH box helicase [Bacteroidales bacterium]|nr:DEAD/DEAH box helicase [Bacteroidales bacterium]MBN2764048.1 DEAD/DEAH box helicase [Bacteroidales bacterium]
MNNTQKKTGKPNRYKSFRHHSSVKGRFSKKRLDADLFIKKAQPVNETQYTASRVIKDLPVNKSIIANLIRKGYVSPTEIQEKSIEPILKGRDLMGLAQTGTGKTGAFLIPLAHNLLGKRPSFQILVISPTRELAVQIEQEFKSIALGLGLYSGCLIGGTDVRKDIMKLRKPYHIVIGTPGRISDMVRQGAIDLSHFSTLVLDEFDRLLDMGFSPDILKIVDGMNNRKQTILFSATEDKSQKIMIGKLLNSPVEVRLRNGNVCGDNIDQEIIRISEGEKKMDVLINLINDPSFEKVLIFDDTKHGVSRICRDLRKAGIRADEIHGNKSQNYRINALEAFKNRKIQVLVATDVAARGIDIVNVSHVINYQQPQNMDSYIHRIGRTGRAGKSGKAYTFVN